MRSRPSAPGLVTGLLLVLPLFALVVQAFADDWRAPALLPADLGLRGIREAFSGRSAVALGNSLIVALGSVLVALALAWPAARVLGERRLRRPGPVYVLLAAPLLVPSYAIGSGLNEWLIRLGIDGTLPALMIAHVTFVLPYTVVILLSGFGPRLSALEEMAATAGMAPGQRLLRVTIPAAAPTIAAAALLGFLVSWSDYGTSLAVGAGEPMLPLVLLPFIGADPQIAASLALLFLAPAVLALVVAVRAGRRPL